MRAKEREELCCAAGERERMTLMLKWSHTEGLCWRRILLNEVC